MNNQHFSFIQDQAEAILKEFQDKYKFPNSPPVLIEMIVQDLGLQYKSRELGLLHNRTRGALSVGDRTIYVDEACYQHQYTFTVAHEIGHWVLHEGNNQGYLGETQDIPLSQYLRYLRERSTKTKKKAKELQETEANRFAAALLIPSSFLFSELKSYKVIDEKAIEELATVFCTSKQAMIYRIKDLWKHGKWIGPQIDLKPLESRATGQKYTQKQHTQQHLNFPDHPDIDYKTQKTGCTFADYLHKQRKAQVAKKGCEKPYAIEFAGTPNAGKDTLIGIAADRLKYVYNYKVEIVDEVVKDYPGSKRWDINGLYQKVSVTAMRLIEALIDNPRQADFVLFNRGVFDASAWVYLYYKNELITEEQKRVLIDYLLCDKVVELVNDVFLLLISSKEALQREKENRGAHVAVWTEMEDWIDPKKIRSQGILKKSVLDRLNTSYREIYQKYYEDERRFKKVHLLDFTDEECISIEDATKRLAQVFPKPAFSMLQPSLFSGNGHSKTVKNQQRQDQSLLQPSLFSTIERFDRSEG